jgi:hypothetical protein
MSILLGEGGGTTASVDETHPIQVISGCNITIPGLLADRRSLY